MVIYLAFSLFFVASSFAEVVNVIQVPDAGQIKENVNSTPKIAETPVILKDNVQLGLPVLSHVINDSKCPYTTTLLQLLATLLEFLHNSSETEKVNKAVVVLKYYLENAPKGPGKDELYLFLKYIQDYLQHGKGPLRDYFTKESSNNNPTTTIVFKNKIPNLGQPQCKEQFTKFLQKAYSAYLDIAKFPNCQQISFSNEAYFMPGAKQVYPFDVNYNYSPKQFSGDNIHIPPSLYNVDVEHPFYNFKYFYNTPETKNNPLNILLGTPEINSNKPVENWSIINNKVPQYTDILSQYTKNPPEALVNLVSPPNFGNGNLINESGPKPFNLLTKPESIKDGHTYAQLPKGFVDMAIMPHNNAFTSNNFTSPVLGQLNLSGLNDVINSPQTPLLYNYIKDVTPIDHKNIPNTPDNKDIDYSILLSQLGLTPLPGSNNLSNQNVFADSNNPLGNLALNTQNINRDNANTNNPLGNVFTINHGVLNPPLNNLNGMPYGITNSDLNNKVTLDKQRIPIPYDKFIVSHDRTPYILEYIASLKNSANPNSYLGNLNNNYGGRVSDNIVSPDLSPGLGMTNPVKLPNKEGVIELTYVLKRPQPLLYHPVYYVKYRLPYAKFVENYRNLILQKPVLRSEPIRIYQELISLSNITEVSPNLKGHDMEEILKTMAQNGTLVKAKLIDDKDDVLREQLEIVKELNSNVTPDDINYLTNATIDHAEILNGTEKETYTNSKLFPGTVADVVANYKVKPLNLNGVPFVHSYNNQLNAPSENNYPFVNLYKNRIQPNVTPFNNPQVAFNNNKPVVVPVPKVDFV